MDRVLAELNKLINSLGLSLSSINETINTIYISKKIQSSKEIDVILKYDFTEIFSLLDSAFILKISNEKAINSNYIEVVYDKQTTKEYIEDTIDTYKYINIDITIDKLKLLKHIFNNKINTDDFNINLFLFTSSFIDNMSKLSFIQLEDTLFIKERKNIIIIAKEKILLNNYTTLIIGGNEAQDIINYIETEFNLNFENHKYNNIIEMRNELCHWINGTRRLCPNHIYFDFEDKSYTYTDDIRNYILKISTNLIIPFISDTTLIDENTYKNYSIINGYKKVRIDYDMFNNFDNRQVKFLFKLYTWVYSDKNSDRISILRNIITIVLCSECHESYYMLLIKKSEDIYKSVLNNFDIYLKDNVKEYFEQRHRVKEMITNKSKDITNQIGFIIEMMNKNFLTSIGVVIAAILGYIPKANIYIVKLTIAVYGGYILISSIYYIPFYWIRVMDIIFDYQEHLDTFRKVLIPEDIPDDSVINKSKKYFKIYWIGSLIIAVVILVISVLSLLYTQKLIDIIKNIF